MVSDEFMVGVWVSSLNRCGDSKFTLSPPQELFKGGQGSLEDAYADTILLSSVPLDLPYM